MKGPPLPPPRFGSLVEMLRSASTSTDGVTFVDAQEHERTFPWPEVWDRARHAAALLLREGVRQGDRIAIVLPTGPEFLDAFFGALLAGGVPVPLYPPVRLGRLREYETQTARMLDAAGARVLVTDSKCLMVLGGSLRQAGAKVRIVRAAALASHPGTYATSPDPDALALVQFSSGSTRSPRPVALSHRQLLAQVCALDLLMPAPRKERHLGVSWLPLYHDMGLIGCLLFAAYVPGPLVLIRPETFLTRPAIWLRTMSRHRATTSAGPNFAYGLCLKRIRDEELAGVDLSAWTYAVNGAEPISPALLDRFAERFARFGFCADSLMPVYGLSEASLAVTFSQRRSPAARARVDPQELARRGEVLPGEREIVSVGRPIPGVEVEVRDALGHPVGERRVGEIWMRGPSVMAGYLGGDGDGSSPLREGWLDTGDLGFHAGGELYVCGRSKDLVIVRGANHSPQVFEDALEPVDGVRTGCAVALGFVPEAGGNEELLLLVETHEPSAALEETIRGVVAERTGIRPHTVKLLAPGTLPRTSSGKLRRQEALRQYLAGELAAPSRVTLARLMLEAARSGAALAQQALRDEP